jgi:hypothetical protein
VLRVETYRRYSRHDATVAPNEMLLNPLLQLVSDPNVGDIVEATGAARSYIA